MLQNIYYKPTFKKRIKNDIDETMKKKKKKLSLACQELYQTL